MSPSLASGRLTVTSALDSLSVWMATKKSERLEFKEAKNRYDFEKLVTYCAALANEGGGRLILLVLGLSGSVLCHKTPSQQRPVAR